MTRRGISGLFLMGVLALPSLACAGLNDTGVLAFFRTVALLAITITYEKDVSLDLETLEILRDGEVLEEGTDYDVIGTFPSGSEDLRTCIEVDPYSGGTIHVYVRTVEGAPIEGHYVPHVRKR